MVGSEQELKARKIALWAIGSMVIIWIVLSYLSFIDSGDRVRPRTQKVDFQGVSALKGKQVFQAYNCMDCHTIVGNGAYFAPDLTKIFETSGPAWLRAYLGSPGTYPAKAIVNVQLQQLVSKGEKLPKDIDAYLEKYPDAKERVEKRGGVEALMPNLKFTAEEIDALIAYFKYTALINTAGWPPKVIAKESVVEAEARKLEEKSGIIMTAASIIEGKVASSAHAGLELAQQFGCTACHSDNGSTLIGPSFKGLFGSTVVLENGQKVNADEAYLKASITDPNAQIVKGFPVGVMPTFGESLTDEDVSKLTEYIKSLK